eukprot:99785-Amphidinium_carterae.1
MSLKIHTDDLGPVSTTTADNVVLATTATVNWRIVDPARAARMAADTMPTSTDDRKLMNPNANPVLRDDVLKQEGGFETSKMFLLAASIKFFPQGIGVLGSSHRKC